MVGRPGNSTHVMYSLKNRDFWCSYLPKVPKSNASPNWSGWNVPECSSLFSVRAHTLPLTSFQLAPAHTPKMRGYVISWVSFQFKTWEFTGSTRRKQLHTKEPPSLQLPKLLEFMLIQWKQNPLTAKLETALGNRLFRNGFAIQLEIQVKKERRTKEKKSGTSSLSTQLPARLVTSWQTPVCCCGDNVCPTSVAARGVQVPSLTCC